MHGIHVIFFVFAVISNVILLKELTEYKVKEKLLVSKPVKEKSEVSKSAASNETYYALYNTSESEVTINSRQAETPQQKQNEMTKQDLLSFSEIQNETMKLLDLWKGRYISPENFQMPSSHSIVDVVVTFCKTDFTETIDEINALLPDYVKQINLIVMSKCGQETLIEEKIKLKLNERNHERSRIEYQIHTLINKGGCDLGVAHYINNFIRNETEESARKKVVFFLKDTTKSQTGNTHIRGIGILGRSHWRSLEEMWNFASKGRFICGINRIQRVGATLMPSTYHHPYMLEGFALRRYVRFNDPTHMVGGNNFTAGYMDLRQFIKQDLKWYFPNMVAVEVCFGGAFALPGTNILQNKNFLEQDLPHVINILENGSDISIVEHFLERLWAAFLSTPLTERELQIFTELQTEAWPKRGIEGIYVTDKFDLELDTPNSTIV
ncbi:hypothetical protein CTEN210_17851 [Chaetoceros tenuissimus]|uniref:Uncharacterized protein n=1 Tax=Chaetoceros tenuissimus TaxID=426638 RepID=A0AAD3DE87_9STRA|nr:hypothetical protein CTEN210_17851 [Chaetoceros tenuissimus]